jgi:hypothetical protein
MTVVERVAWCQDDSCGDKIPAGRRSDAEFCSSACRQRSYRRRKRLFAPYGGDANRALAWLISVTAKSDG